MPRVEIRLEGHLEPGWEKWLGDFRISHAENKQTVLIGDLKDQAAFDRLIAKLRDLGLNLVSIRTLE